MTFTATHARAFVGTDIAVTVTAGGKEEIASVTVELDGLLLDEVELGSGTESYTRTFSEVGGGSPGMDHTLVVTAEDGDRAPHSATTRWADV